MTLLCACIASLAAAHARVSSGTVRVPDGFTSGTARVCGTARACKCAADTARAAACAAGICAARMQRTICARAGAPVHSGARMAATAACGLHGAGRRRGNAHGCRSLPSSRWVRVPYVCSAWCGRI